MKLFSIADLHLPARQKPMDIFGPHWENHFDKIARDWEKRVTDEDIVLLPGDLSWAMHLEEALEDLEKIACLPGRKILLRGNHDYWWSSIGKLRRALPEGMYALQNDSLYMDGILFGGSRGWTIPMGEGDTGADIKIYQRERMRLEMSLGSGRDKYPEARLIALMHYPPRTAYADGFSDILDRYGVSDCVYGHLHGPGIAGAVTGRCGGVRYHLVSCDSLGFQLLELPSKGMCDV